MCLSVDNIVISVDMKINRVELDHDETPKGTDYSFRRIVGVR